MVRPFSREVGSFFSVCSLQEPKGDGAGQSLHCLFRHLNKKEIHKVPATIYSRDPRLNWPDVLTAVIDYNENLVLFHIHNFRSQREGLSFPHTLCTARENLPRVSLLPGAGMDSLLSSHTCEELLGFANAVRNKALHQPPS